MTIQQIYNKRQWAHNLLLDCDIELDKILKNKGTFQGKSAKLLDEFITYCVEHPQERFWQALRNWSGYDKIYGEKYNNKWDDQQLIDTFYK